MTNTNNQLDVALNPPLAMSRLGDRLLTPLEYMQRTAATCETKPRSPLSCAGTVHVGMFFDGTGNNEEIDFKKPQAQGPRFQKHSNVVRLYHAHPDKLKIGNDGYYRYYIPGLGTPFREIGDGGEGLGRELGNAFGRYGAARIAWGLTRVFNAVSQHAYERDLIDNKEAAALAEEASTLVVTPAMQDVSPMPSAGAEILARTVIDTVKKHWGAQRAPEAFGKPLQQRLQGKLRGFAPVGHIVVNVFGFSRGAAEARVFVNWLFGICEQKDGQWLLAGIPLRVQFLGIFDTVASVGIAGMYSIVEGHLGWAENNLQVHPAVARCVHMVAAHEVRSCFPLDSVRIGGKYPPNAVEYVYPGSHSDVGGGYIPECLGKADWYAESPTPDRQLARVPGFEMYCQALAAGVPFQRFEATGSFDAMEAPIRTALKPSRITAEAFDHYFKAASIAPAPVEDMVGQQMSLYFTHRLYVGIGAELKRVGKPSGGGKDAKDALGAREAARMDDTQAVLLFVVAGLCAEIKRRIAEGGATSAILCRPFVSDAGATGKLGALSRPLLNFGIPPVVLVEMFKFVGGATNDIVQRGRVLSARDPALMEKLRSLSRDAPNALRRWRKFLADGAQADIRDIAVERDAVRLLEALREEALPKEVCALLDGLVHDSMAGFDDAMHPYTEFMLNGHGIAKFRRIFFGNEGDVALRAGVARRNEASIAAAQTRRANRARWDAESREYARTRS